MNSAVVAALFYGAVIGFMCGLFLEGRRRSADADMDRIRQQIESLRSEVYQVTRYLRMEPINRVPKGL